MQNWTIRKNHIDMDYNQALQEYQVLLASKWTVPIGIFAVFIQQGLNTGILLLGLSVAYLFYRHLTNRLAYVKKKLSRFKTRVSSLEI